MCSVTLQSREGSEIEAHRIVLSANELHDKIQQSEQVSGLVAELSAERIARARGARSFRSCIWSVLTIVLQSWRKKGTARAIPNRPMSQANS